MNIKTKQNLIESAREIFSNNEYINISMKDFADKLQMSADDLPDHYDKKSKIAGAVYSDLYLQINDVLLNCDININNSLLLLFTSMRIFYELILMDKNAKFTCDVLKQEACSPISYFLKEVYWNIVKEYGVAISEKELNLMLSCNCSMQGELLLQYINGEQGEFNIDNIFIFLQSAIPRLLKIDHSYIDDMLLKSIGIAKVIDKTNLRLLL